MQGHLYDEFSDVLGWAGRPPNERVPLQIARKVNEVWSMDYVSDSLSNGRRIKCLTVRPKK